MNAPVTTDRMRTRTPQTRTPRIPAQRGAPAAPLPRSGGPAAVIRPDGPVRQDRARKAYARRDDRLRRLVGGRGRTSSTTGRAQFVLLVMALLAVGLVATLWLSTAAAADSYRLQDARAQARTLSQQSERLHREVAVLESAPELARRADELGMVPVQDSARIVVAADGAVSVVGHPRAVPVPAPPVVPAPVDPGAATVGPGAPIQVDPGGAAPVDAVAAPADGAAAASADAGAG